MNTRIAPQQDFFNYVNDNWVTNVQIPADKARWGSFDELAEQLGLTPLKANLTRRPSCTLGRVASLWHRYPG